MSDAIAPTAAEAPLGVRERLDPALLRPNDLHGFLEVFGNIGAHVGLLFVASRTTQLWAIIPLVLIIGVTCHRLFFPLHDCLHRTLFQSRLLNSTFGHLLAGLIGMPFHPFRQQHLAHHRDFAKPEDPGAEDYRVRFESRWDLVGFLLAPLVGATFIARLWGYVRRLVWHSSEPITALASSSPVKLTWHQRLRNLREILVAALVQLGVIAFLTHMFTLDQLWRYPVFGILPLVTVFLCLNRLRMFLEHASLDYSKSDYLAGIGHPIARTIYATPLERLLICGGNFNYHHEHHLYPVVPGCNLPTLHREIKPTIDAHEIRQSYCQVLKEIWCHLGRGHCGNDCR